MGRGKKIVRPNVSPLEFYAEYLAQSCPPQPGRSVLRSWHQRCGPLHVPLSKEPTSGKQKKSLRAVPSTLPLSGPSNSQSCSSESGTLSQTRKPASFPRVHGSRDRGLIALASTFSQI